jgi:hypothetical protein
MIKVYNQASKKLTEAIETACNVDIFPVVGWEQFLGSKHDLVSIPYKVTFDCEKEQGHKLFKIAYKRYPILVIDEVPGSGIRDMKGGVYSRFQIFDFMLSSYGGSVAIEKLKSVKSLNVIKKFPKITDTNRFFYLFLHITLREMVSWAQKDYGANKIYFDSDIGCFPDVAIDLGFSLRNSSLDTSVGGWHAIAKIKKEN